MLRVLEMYFECTSITFIFYPERQTSEIFITVRKIFFLPVSLKNPYFSIMSETTETFCET